MSDFSIVRDRIRQRLEELSLTANAASERAGIDRSILRKFMNESVKELREHNLKAVAKGLRVTPQWLLGETDDKGEGEEGFQPNQHDVPILGIVESGAYRPLNWFDQADLGYVHNGYDPNFAGEIQFAFVVRGDQMDKAGISDGDEIICVNPWDVAVQVGDGDWVVVECKSQAGDTRELTVKELHIDREQIHLMPRSSSRQHQTFDLPLDADLINGPTRIVGVVTSVIRRKPVKLGARSSLRQMFGRASQDEESSADSGAPAATVFAVSGSTVVAAFACKMFAVLHQGICHFGIHSHDALHQTTMVF
jgi:SOS-response transcriptional repressor LexA